MKKMAAAYIILVGLQILGLIVVYHLLKKRIARVAEPDAVLDKVRNELNSIMVELNSTTDQNVRLISNRIEQLKELLSTTDRKISLLKRETEKHDVSKAVYSQIMNRGPQIGAKKVGDKSVQDEVIKLHREGFSAGVIAGHVGTTVAEVELIISMATKKE